MRKRKKNYILYYSNKYFIIFRTVYTHRKSILPVHLSYERGQNTTNTNEPRARREKKGKDSETVPNWSYGELRNLSMQNLSLHLHVTVWLVPRANTFRDR